jgi:TRAP-type mannitol/chloroaromatic compound transport system permease large subunit
MVQRTYGAMTNDVLISIPLFVLMGYVMERGALVDKMFYSIQLAFRRVPASLAVATLIVCTFWGIASGLVGAVVVLMGVIAFNPMLRAGYDVKLASGVITAGGTLGILIPPSVMIIVYAAVAGQSVVKLYAAAMFPGFFLAFLYLGLRHRLGADQSEDRAALPEEQTRVTCRPGSRSWDRCIRRTCFVALAQGAGVARAGKTLEIDGKPHDLWGPWCRIYHRPGAVPDLDHHAVADRVWYVVIHQQAGRSLRTRSEGLQQLGQAGWRGPEATPAKKVPELPVLSSGFGGSAPPVLLLWNARSYWRMNVRALRGCSCS